MITERQFSAGFTSFWKDSLPNLETAVRALNWGWERVHRPAATKSLPGRRDLISESGYRTFVLNMQGLSVSREVLYGAFNIAARKVGALRPKSRGAPGPLSDDEVGEVLRLAARLRLFVRERLNSITLNIEPRYVGHGMLSECFGDIADETQMIEIKYVDRTFRSADLKQCLVYSALRYLERGYTYSSITLYNPFLGVAFDVGVNEIVFSSSGRPFAEFVSDFSYATAGGELSR